MIFAASSSRQKSAHTETTSSCDLHIASVFGQLFAVAPTSSSWRLKSGSASINPALDHATHESYRRLRISQPIIVRFDLIQNERAAAGFRQIIGYIDADNAASLGLHEKFGFSRASWLPGGLQAWPLGRYHYGSALTRYGSYDGSETCVVVRTVSGKPYPKLTRRDFSLDRG
jgi:hypothetical protein